MISSLASEAKHPGSLKKLESFLGGFKNKKLLYIPAAANGENIYGIWKTESKSRKVVNTLNAKVEPLRLEDYKTPEVLEKFRNKDIVWFAGGAAAYSKKIYTGDKMYVKKNGEAITVVNSKVAVSGEERIVRP